MLCSGAEFWALDFEARWVGVRRSPHWAIILITVVAVCRLVGLLAFGAASGSSSCLAGSGFGAAELG